ncbi:hypothetical protein SAMN05444920_101320 [Nonomuraea solani]|uniref:Aromatic ring-opening dioxygenase, LigB subunit n=1 Tax=Nonomuraea solani TaxID=1144553 RepID=A0A1H5TWC9_9ACTN|nr:hypothetical protein [Nonomuraea solani]SEF66508.1 hypothetical protein SAMN05444920_101320 [Nonomuraea solani]
MLVAAAVCPPTPLVVLELPDLRSTCHTAIDALRAARPDTLVIVGGAEATSAYDGTSAGTLRPWGLDVTAGGGEPVLPLSLTIGRLLLDDDPGLLQSVAFDATGDECRELGAKLAVAGDRVALLVMADGSACLSPRAPGRYDDAAGPFNDHIATALAGADAGALTALDPAEADRLWVSGRAALQVLAGAAGPAAFEGRLLMATAPYGVGYFTGVWT